MFITASQSDAGHVIGVGFSPEDLVSLRAGSPFKFELSRVGIGGTISERFCVVTFETEEIRQWREIRAVPREYAIVCCLQEINIERIRDGGFMRMPRDRNNIGMILFSPDTSLRCGELMAKIGEKWPS